MTRSTNLTTAFCLLLVLLGAPPLPAQARGGTREAMADAMAKMMEAMGLLDDAPSSAMPTDPMSMASPFGGSGWGPPAGGMPWGSPFQDPSRAFGMAEVMKQFSRNVPPPGSGMSPWRGSRLEGIWEGRGGELLIVQGNRFRIYAGNTSYVDGYLHIDGDRLALYNAAEKQAQPFKYAESDGRLVMRGKEGEIYLYRRLRLDGRAASPPEH